MRKYSPLLTLTSMALAAALTACGGGGGGGSATVGTSNATSSTTPAVTTPPPVVSTLSTTIQPTTYAAGSLELNNYNRLNAVRLAGGFGTVAQDLSIDRAATAHSNYVITNSKSSTPGVKTQYALMLFNVDPATGILNAHVESPNMPGFTGILPQNRITAAGGTHIQNGSEVMGGYGVDCVDGLLNTVFHRSGLLGTQIQFVGFGIVAATSSFYDPLTKQTETVTGYECTINYGYKVGANIGATNGAPTNWIGIYPGIGQTNVPVGMPVPEAPDPAPEIPNASKGSPVSIYFERPIGLVKQFTLTAAGSGTPVPVKLIMAKDFPGYVQASEAHILPTQNLVKGTTYTVVFDGTMADGAAVFKTWTFTTTVN